MPLLFLFPEEAPWVGTVSALSTGSPSSGPWNSSAASWGRKQQTMPSLRAAMHRGGKNDSLMALWLRTSVGSKLMLWCPNSDAMQRAADRKPLSAQEGVVFLTLRVINFSSFIESLLIFDVTGCWVHDKAFLCNILGVAPPWLRR